MTTTSVRATRHSDPGARQAQTGADPFADIPSAMVQDAARRVFAGFRNDTGDAVDAAEVCAVLTSLATRVARGEAAPESGTRERTASAVLARRLLELLRMELICQWSASSPSADDMLQTLRGVEAVRRELEPDWSEYFQSRLLGPGALELVVEVAHDLRSPLTSILFLAETLQRGQSGSVNDVQRRQLGLIYGAALGLSSVTSDVMELARGGDRLVDKEPAPFSISEIFESVRDIVHPIAEEKGLKIRIAPPESDHRLGHPLALSRVLLNLTTNALKFTDEGWVEITGDARDSWGVEFSVRDTGRGISPEALESLYQPFRRTAARNEYCFSGTGLGLAICSKLVEAMGSALHVETRSESGTRFYFNLALPPAETL